MSRCYNQHAPAYKDYGGRGIVVCDAWHDYSIFVRDVGRKPTPSHTIDRFPNNNGNYEPGNVRWATMQEQNCNRRSNTIIEHNGEALPLVVWLRRFGFKPKTHLKAFKKYLAEQATVGAVAR